jgi:hypothetical protein
MIKKYLIFILIGITLTAFRGGSGIPHGEYDEHKRIRSNIWETLAMLEYRQNNEGEWRPYFHPALLALNGRVVELKGYMVPFDYGVRFNNFGLSVLPIAQCHFCGRGDIPEIVEVYTDDRITFSNKPIRLRGMIMLNDSDSDELTLQLHDAKLIE